MLRPIVDVDQIKLDSLLGIDKQKNQLIRNTERFLNNQPANNALLWGARGTGKSSLVKAIFNKYRNQDLRLIEIYKNDLHDLPDIVDQIRNLAYRFVIYCDDFSFEANDDSYIGLKTLLEGSIEQSPENTILYATSNRRHLLPEYMKDNHDASIVNDEIHYSDVVEEKIALSDRFGLWLSFYPMTMEQYLEIIDNYFHSYDGNRQLLHKDAEAFARLRGSKSGRTARQFFNSYNP